MPFLALVVSLPASAPSDRTRIWRALRALGSGVLREGMYVLPAGEPHAAALQQLADEARAAGGTGEVFALDARDQAQAASLQALFDRTDEYRALTDELKALLVALRKDAAGALRQLRVLERKFEQLAAIDYFPGPAQAQVEALVESARAEAARRVSPDEPQPARRPVRPLDRRDYQGRRWATRRRPWVDRLASAWLIRRRIDPRAEFVWIDKPAQCKGDMVGYDFDGAQFSHVGERVTYQVLLASFELDGDAVLARIGETVRYLDVGGVPTAEARGLETVLAGARASIPDDDKLLAAAFKVFDWLADAFRGQLTDDSAAGPVDGKAGNA
jgi:hypothetical protein